MELIHLINLAMVLTFVIVKIIKAYKETYNVSFKKDKINFDTDADLFYFDGKRARNI